MSNRHELEPSADRLYERHADRAKTLFIGGWFCTCGNCDGNAYMHDKSHEIIPGEDQKGCGTTWEYVSSDELLPEDTTNIRPDLQWRAPESQDMGISRATEERVIGDMQVLGPFRLEDIIGREN